MKGHNAFTLAEVLITLSVVGVVAAMTMPTLVNKINGAQRKAKFKKTLSTLSQAASMAYAQYDVNFANTDAYCGDVHIGGSSRGIASSTDLLGEYKYNSFCSIFNSTLKDGKSLSGGDKNHPMYYLGSTYELFGGQSNIYTTNMLAYRLTDGTIFAFNQNAKGCKKSYRDEFPLTAVEGSIAAGIAANCVGFIDVNGPAGPNKIVNVGHLSNGKYDYGTYSANYNKLEINDIFPVYFHDGIVEPASYAAQMALK